MQAVVKLTAVNGAQIRAAYRKASEVVQGQAMTAALKGMGHQLEGYIKVNIVEKDLVDSGNLLGSIEVDEPRLEGNSGTIDVGTNVVYARIHEFGGMIRPKNAKHLAVPQPGVKGGPRNYSDLSFQPSVKHPGEGWLKNKDGKLMFWLAKVVHMPAKPFMRPAFDDHIRDLEITAAAVLSYALKKVWK